MSSVFVEKIESFSHLFLILRGILIFFPLWFVIELISHLLHTSSYHSENSQNYVFYQWKYLPDHTLLGEVGVYACGFFAIHEPFRLFEHQDYLMVF
jgi:hypothetical protein